MSVLKKITLIVVILLMSSNLFAETKKVTIDILVSSDSCPEKCEKCETCEKQSCDEGEISYKQGYELCEGDLPKAYNAPARINVCDIDTFVTSSFIYWDILTDQTDLGILRNGNLESTEYDFIIRKFPTNYVPGFKVGIGTKFFVDNWDLFAQYTRLHKTNHTSFDFTNPNFTNTFFTPWSMVGKNFILTPVGNIRASKKFDLDKIDLELARSFYVGKNLTLKSFVGTQVHLLNQNYNIQYTDKVTGAGSVTFDIPIRLFLKNDSWALGPRLGLGANWIFYKGFRLFGSGVLNLLYTENEISGFGSNYSKFGAGNPTNISFTVKKDKQTVLRDVEELMLGFGWGSYFKCDKWHFDLFVAYETQRYSHTNYIAQVAQMPDIDDDTGNLLIGNTSSNLVKPGDSFLHGLTVSARFDF